MSRRTTARLSIAGALLVALACAALAQTPAGEADKREAAIENKQRQAGTAYRELQQAQYEARLAEQDFLNAQEAQAAAQKQADARKQQLDAAKKALDTARTKVAQARQRYEATLTGVDVAFQKPPAR